MSALEENKNNLVSKIQENQNNLEQYKKHTTGSKIVDQNSVLNKPAATKQSSKKPPPGINCDEMLSQIKKKLCEIRKQDNNKNPIQLLEVSCSSALMLFLGYRDDRY
jgi:hypothetical protein